MKIESIRVITGANVYSHEPVVVARLDLAELKEKIAARRQTLTRGCSNCCRA